MMSLLFLYFECHAFEFYPYMLLFKFFQTCAFKKYTIVKESSKVQTKETVYFFQRAIKKDVA